MGTAALARPSNSRARTRSSRVVRTTLKLPESVDQNVEVYCASARLTKNDALLQLISKQLEAQGYRPNEIPYVSVSYKK